MLSCSVRVFPSTALLTSTQTSTEPSTSSISRLQLRAPRTRSVSQTLRSSQRSTKGVVRASLKGEGEKVQEFASEKAVEGGPQLTEDAKNLSNGSPQVLDAKADQASDEASYDGDMKDKVIDVASDTAVDEEPDVAALAKKDAEGVAGKLGRSVEEAAQGLEDKAEQVSDRAARMEGLGGSTESSEPDSFFKDQVVEDSVLDAASASAVDEGPEVTEVAKKDAEEMSSKVGGDVRRNMVTIEDLAATASRLEAARSGTDAKTGGDDKKVTEDQFRGSTKRPILEDLTRSLSKNLKEGIDSNRPGIEEISKNVAAGVKAGRENLQYGAEGAIETGEYAKEGLDAAKGALEKRIKGINIAAEEAKETGSKAASLAVKGWEVLSKTTERFVDKFQKNVGATQENVQQGLENTKGTVERKVGEAKQNVEGLKNTAQDKAGEAKEKVEENAEKVQSKFGDAKEKAEQNLERAREKVQETTGQAKGSLEQNFGNAKKDLGKAGKSMESSLSASSEGPSKDSFSSAVNKMTQEYEGEQGNEQLKGSMGSDGGRSLKAETDPVPPEKDDEWTGKAN